MNLKRISTKELQNKFSNELENIQFFEPKEYLYDKSFNYWVEIQYSSNQNLEEQIKNIAFKLNALLKLLDNVRIHFNSRVIITSGIRDFYLLNLIMEKWGEHQVSKTTDHSYGLPYNFRGVGALDHFVEGVPTKEVYEYEKNNFYDYIGQLIYYKKTLGNFCHIANNRNIIFSKNYIHKVLPTYTKFIVKGED